MTDLFDKKITDKLVLRHILLLISGLALTFSIFLAWLIYNNLGNLEVLTGIDLCQRYAEFPEIPILSLIGITLFIGALTIPRCTEFTTTSRYPKYVAVFLSILALIISIETAFRLQMLVKEQIGVDFFYNTGCGWYLAIGGAVFSLVTTLIPRRKREKQ